MPPPILYPQTPKSLSTTTRPNLPYGGEALQTNRWQAEAGWIWGPMCGVNLGTNRGTKGDLVRILGPTADWSPRPAVGPSTPCGGRILRPSQIMTMDYKWPEVHPL